MEDSNKDTNSEALTTTEAKLEMVKNNSGTGVVARMRAADGKFVATTKNAARRDAVRTQKFLLEVDSDTGKSRNDSLIEALYKQSLLADSKSLGSAVKFMEAIDNKAGFTKVKNTLLEDHSHIQSVVKVIINAPILMHNEVVDGNNPPPAMTAPSWAATEPAPVPVIDAEYVTNPRGGPKR